jgi:elongation factor G
VLLEPLEDVRITTPNDYLGDVMGDLSSRRGQILGTDAADAGFTEVKAVVPQAELHLYATTLNSLTHGRARFSHKFRGYEQMPADAAHKVVADAQNGEAAAG